jgi:hypothetical protein
MPSPNCSPRDFVSEECLTSTNRLPSKWRQAQMSVFGEIQFDAAPSGAASKR